MSSSTLPQELRDRIQSLAINDEIIQVRTVSTPEYQEEVLLERNVMEDMTEEEIEEFFENQQPPPEYSLIEVQLIFSPNLDSLLAPEETRDQIMELIYQNCTVDLSEITLRGKPEYHQALYEKLHKFRKVRVGLGIAGAFAKLFDHIDHLSFFVMGYTWPMLEDTSATTWGRALKSLYPLTDGAVVDLINTPKRGPTLEIFRLVEDPERDTKAVAWGKSVNGI